MLPRLSTLSVASYSWLTGVRYCFDVPPALVSAAMFVVGFWRGISTLLSVGSRLVAVKSLDRSLPGVAFFLKLFPFCMPNLVLVLSVVVFLLARFLLRFLLSGCILFRALLLVSDKGYNVLLVSCVSAPYFTWGWRPSLHFPTAADVRSLQEYTCNGVMVLMVCLHLHNYRLFFCLAVVLS